MKYLENVELVGRREKPLTYALEGESLPLTVRMLLMALATNMPAGTTLQQYAVVNPAIDERLMLPTGDPEPEYVELQDPEWDLLSKTYKAVGPMLHQNDCVVIAARLDELAARGKVVKDAGDAADGAPADPAEAAGD